jgi:tetratricopeptide (TPR) repeat protein
MNNTDNKEFKTNPDQEKLDELLVFFRDDKPKVVLKKAENLVKEFPFSYLLWNIIGVVHSNLKRYVEAEAAFNQVIKLNPGYADVYNNLGIVFRQQGKVNSAIKSFSKAIEIKYDYVDAYNNLGIALNEKGEVDSAVSCFERVLDIDPDNANVNNNLGILFKERGLLDDAAIKYLRAIEISPDFVDAHNNLGVLMHEQGKLDQAILSFRRALDINPSYVNAYNSFGALQNEQGRQDEAQSSYVKALTLQPNNVVALNNLGITLKEKGDFEEARKCFLRTLSYKPDYADCARNLSVIFEDEDKQLLTDTVNLILSKAKPESDDYMYAYFAMANVNIKSKKYSDAVRCLDIASSKWKHKAEYVFHKDQYLFKSIKSIFMHSVGDISETAINTVPIFILGMPRSGTSLVEQILSSHSEVYGAGELDAMRELVQLKTGLLSELSISELRKVRDSYLSVIDGFNGSSCKYVTDKMPLNFRWIGYILTAIPEAKIIHVNRDPRAICWSNYKTFFPEKGMAFTSDQFDVANYFHLYSDLMEFWKEKFPGCIYDLNYEALTENQEIETKRLLEYLDLPWQDNVLEFHNNKRPVRTASSIQVRKKMYKGSSNEWRKYERWLQPMLTQLSKPLKLLDSNDVEVIRVGNKEIKLNDLSDAARSQLANIQAVDQQIADIQQQIAIMQAARNVYLSALKNELG